MGWRGVACGAVVVTGLSYNQSETQLCVTTTTPTTPKKQPFHRPHLFLLRKLCPTFNVFVVLRC